MKLKVFALLLAILTVLPLVIACAETAPGDEVTTEDLAETTPSPDNTNEEPVETILQSATLPDNLNFGGETIYFLSRDSVFVDDEVSVQDQNGAQVNDAIYNRNKRVEQLLGIKIDDRKITGDNYVVSTELRNAAKNGEANFDIAANSTYSTIMYTAENILVDLTECEYLDLDAIYWSQGFNEQASFGEAQYLCTGAMAISLFRYMFVTFYNKQLVENTEYEDLYGVVDSGKWTLDYQIKLAKDLYKDNGDGNVTEDDTFGFATSTVLYVDPYWSSCDVTILKKNADNIPEYALDIEKVTSVFGKVIELYHRSSSWMDNSSGDDGKQNALSAIFSSGRAATTTMRLVSVETNDFLNMETEYGIIPVPKYDDAQEKYYTYLHDQFTSFGITSVVSRDEERVQMLGAVLEALALYSYRDVVPTYYELALKGRYLEDSESWRMLDMIYENVRIDAGVLYTKQLDSIHQVPRDPVKNGASSLTALFKAKEVVVRRKLDALVDGITKLES